MSSPPAGRVDHQRIRAKGVVVGLLGQPVGGLVADRQEEKILRSSGGFLRPDNVFNARHMDRDILVSDVVPARVSHDHVEGADSGKLNEYVDSAVSSQLTSFASRHR
ncbi:hypothetical protein [Frankia nepalensis]|uniref:hypothetical protein n=1 Tax=Frankia nepalensis TaxID=1836974 RepID=UPI001932AA85|nr:hypothetical protein [Frankia nepalensis]MBL7501204.1 hypothetical protein [Frankia nepalensis]MBL7516471.1 hypothetical protein [Frankia nepalensis]